MLLDMLANFDWKRPIYLTQVYIPVSYTHLDVYKRQRYMCVTTLPARITDMYSRA